MEVKIRRTNHTDPDFVMLAEELDRDLAGRYGPMEEKRKALNATSSLLCVLVLLADGVPAACGGYKKYQDGSAEIKRIFVREAYRRKAFAREILRELEGNAREEGFRHAVLETGVRQPEAIRLYKSCGYEEIESYGAYAGDGISVCMQKSLTPA